LTSLALPRSTRGRRLARSRLPVALAVLAGAAVFGAASTARSASPPATSTSRTVAVAQGVVQSTVSGSGNLEPATQQDLSFSTAGEITKVYVAEGDHVAEGQALARVQPTDTSQAVTWLRAPYPATIATVGVAVGDTVSAADTSTATSTGTSTGTTSGSATGTTVSTATTPAFTLVQLSQYQMSVSLSESDVGKVKAGQMATVTVSATGEKLAARVTQVGVLASSSSSSSQSTTSSSSSTAVSYPVTLRLTQTGTGLKPGMTASADIVTGQSTGLTVPTQALHGSTVTVVANGVSTTRRVQTGVAGDSTTEIVSGLKAGDKVLVTSTSAAAGAGASASASQTGQSPALGGQRPGGFGGAAGGGVPSGAGGFGGGGAGGRGLGG
jgi:macrolide-specific efflux system membrane fusion protein